MSNLSINNLLDEAVLHMDFRNRTFEDLSPYKNHGTPTDVHFSGNGLWFGSAGVVEVQDSAELQLTEGSLVVLADLSDSSTNQRFISKRDAGGTNYEWRIATNQCHAYDGTSSRSLTLNSGKDYYAINIKDIPEGFEAGVSSGDYIGALALVKNDAPVYIGNYYPLSTPFIGIMKAVLIFPRELTATEHAELYSYLSNLSWPTMTSVASNALLGVEDDSLLAAGYDMKMEHGILSDQSDNSNHGTVSSNITYEKTNFGDSLNFTGDTSTDIDLGIGVAGAAATVPNLTISMWVNPSLVDGNNRALVSKFDGVTPADDGSILLDISATGISRFLIASGNASFEGITVALQNIFAGAWYHIVGRYNEGAMELFVNGSSVGTATASEAAVPLLSLAWALGNYSDNKTANASFKGNMVTPEIYTEAKSDSWIEKEYEKGKRASFQFKSGIYESVENQTEVLENTHFKIDSGSYKVSRDSIENEDVKVLECISSGLTYIPANSFKQTNTEAAYGEWNFWINKGTSTTPSIMLLSDVSNVALATGYRLAINGTEALSLWRVNGGAVAGTVMSVIDSMVTGIWNHIRMTRDHLGVFTLYINGVIPSVSGGSNPATDNTYKESKYFVFDLDAGDKIALSDPRENYSFTKKLLT